MLYGYALAYLVAPETFSSANVVELIAGLPEGVKYAGKVILAAPFAFHSWNGLRHLSWDVGKCESRPLLLSASSRYPREAVLLTLLLPSSAFLARRLGSPDAQGRVLVWLRRSRLDRCYYCWSRVDVNTEWYNACILAFSTVSVEEAKATILVEGL